MKLMQPSAEAGLDTHDFKNSSISYVILLPFNDQEHPKYHMSLFPSVETENYSVLLHSVRLTSEVQNMVMNIYRHLK